MVTEVGATLRELRSGDRAILDGYAKDAMCTGYRGVPLLPWPNRIEDGHYSFDGVDHQLPIDRVAEHNAIHGLTCWEAWRVVAQGDDGVTLGLDLVPRPGYPFALALTVGYAVTDNGLEVTIGATNTGTTDAPFGAGHHPYVLPRATLDAARLRVPARRCLGLGPRGLPVDEVPVDGKPLDLRAGRTIDDLRLDHCFGALERGQDGRAYVELDDVVVWLDRGFEWVQLYSGDTMPLEQRRRSIAIEPMTCPPNAFRTGRDLLRLRPTERLTFRWGLRL